MKNNIRYYLTKWGYLIEVHQNPCGCHPFDAVVTYSKPDFSRGKSWSYSFSRQRDFTTWAKVRNIEELK
jgi:hypothetical protein